MRFRSPWWEDVRVGRVDLNSPATTLALMKLNAVIGLTGFFNADGSLKSVEFSARFVTPL